jgi:hypothetical protein
MAFSLASFEAELDTVVSSASSYVDLVDKYANLAAKYSAVIPEVGPDVTAAAAVVDVVDKALAALKATLDGLSSG